MSNIKVNLNNEPKDGTEVVFRSPVDCSQVTGLIVYYITDDLEESCKEFIFADAHGNNVGIIDHLFAEDAVVSVILDVGNGMAFVQNSDTNSYLEYRFGLLADSIVNEATGKVITLNDSSNRELQGLRIFGHDRMDDNGEVHIVGEKGSVTVKVMGKNLITLDGFEYMTKQEDGSYKSNVPISADYLVPLFLPEGIYCVSGYIKSPVDKNYRFKIKYTDGTKQESFVKSNGDWQFCVFATNGKAVSAFYFDYGARSDQVYVKDLQIEVGSTATAFEPYKEPQSITVPTPGGMVGGDDLYDEIDFAKGMLIRRISEQTETPLPADVLEAYAKLHTYKPNTTIINDEDAEMSVEYVADTKTYIDNKFTELQNAILSSGANV